MYLQIRPVTLYSRSGLTLPDPQHVLMMGSMPVGTERNEPCILQVPRVSFIEGALVSLVDEFQRASRPSR